MRSLRFRLIAWSTLLLMLGLGASSAIVYWGLSRALYAWVDPALASRASDIQDTLTVRNGQVIIRPSDEDIDPAPSEEDEDQTVYSRLWSASGRVLRVIDPAPHLPPTSEIAPLVRRTVATGKTERTLRAAGGPTRILLIRVPGAGPPAGVLEAGVSTALLTHTLNRLRSVMLVVVPFILVIVIAGSWILITRALTSLNRLGEDAMAVGTRNLGQGIGIPRTGDEVERLARVLDAMLRRLDDAFQRERRFTADASHELRTPLTIIRSELDLAMASSEPAPPETLTAISQEVDRMRSLVHALLELSRSDAGSIPLQRETVRLDQLVEAVVDQSETIAQEAGVTLALKRCDSVSVFGDEARLIQVALNLIDNAIRYTPRGGRVSISVLAAAPGVNGMKSAEAILEVSDTGLGITADQLPHVFERFYRADPSRSSRGTGLGLSIARAIAEAHEGRIELESSVGKGTTAHLILPLIPL